VSAREKQHVRLHTLLLAVLNSLALSPREAMNLLYELKKQVD